MNKKEYAALSARLDQMIIERDKAYHDRLGKEVKCLFKGRKIGV